jgi:hypothetical protein
MNAVASREDERRIPMVMLYIGMPAFLLVAGFSLRDLSRSESDAQAAVGTVAIVVFVVVFAWLAFGPHLARGER